MSEYTDFYMSWLGCSAFGQVSRQEVTIVPPVVFQPTDLSDCLIWLDATDNLTITPVIGQPDDVGVWENKGTYTTNALADVGSVQTGIDTINSLNVITFTAGSQLQMDFQPSANPLTLFFIVKPVTDLSNAAIPFMSFFSAVLDSGSISAGMSFAHPNFSYALGPNGVSITLAADNATDVTGVPLLITMRNDTTSNNKLNLNNATQTLTFDDTASFTLSLFTYLLGYNTHNTAFQMGEFILYNRALSDTEVGTVETYLTDKWNIQPL